MQYQIRHFDGYKIKNYCKNENEYLIDSTDKTTWQTALQSTDLHDDNALFYQIINLIKERKTTESEEIVKDDFLLEEIVFVHFSFGISDDYKNLFNTGFSIFYDEDRKIEYVPFEKSASMSRQGTITFINKDLLVNKKNSKGILDRLMLDLTLTNENIALSKLYAYRGLYLSSGERVVSKDLYLNENTVIVIDDITDNSKLTDIITAAIDGEQRKDIEEDKINENEGDTEKKYFKLINKENQKIKNLNASDGYGLISPQYAQKLNQLLKRKGATSFQIRMPFTKGLLHQVDFHKFIMSNLDNENDYSNLTIKDIYNVDRKISQAQIILTKSMFKCWGWLIKGLEKEKDPMEHYFEKIKEYDHALYVGLTDLNLHNSGLVKLNYQFLSTLNISKHDFEKLKKNHLEYADDEKIEKVVIAKKHIVTVQSEETIGFDEEENEERLDAAWAEAVRKNHKFLKTVKVKGMLNGLKRSIISDMGKGRLYVSGELRFLCGDLGYMLLDILTKCKENNQNITFKTEEEKTIFTSNFYMPSNKIKLCSGKLCPILRNPHLSRNEQALAKAYIAKENTFYDQYFSHLKGIFMVSANSLIPNVIGGADFDGDMVKIINNDIITNALLKKLDTESKPYEKPKTANKDEKEQKLLTRCMPVIEIPHLPPVLLKENEDNKFNTIKNSFNSKVGLISNEAVKWAEKEYFSKTEDEENKGKCAYCTIVTGLEIDAAKTGIHPCLDGFIKKTKNYFLEQKDNMCPDIYKCSYKSELSPDQKKLTLYLPQKRKQQENLSENTNLGEIKNAENLKEELEQRKILIEVENYNEVINTANINHLPYYFAEAMSTFKTFKTQKKNEELPKYYFSFEAATTLKKNSVEDTQIGGQIKDIIMAYNAFENTKSYITWVSPIYDIDSKYASYIYTIFKLQYDGVDESIKTALKSAYSAVDKTAGESQNPKKILEDFFDKKWHFSLADSRNKILKNMFPDMKDDAINLLCNFNYGGYKVLYYIIRDVILTYPEEKKTESKTNKSLEKLSENALTYYEKYRDIYIESILNQETNAISQNKIVSICRKELLEIIKNEFPREEKLSYEEIIDRALEYSFFLKKYDSSSWRFLWDIFTTEEILRNVYNGKQVKNNA